jgi:hypothetical protein
MGEPQQLTVGLGFSFLLRQHNPDYLSGQSDRGSSFPVDARRSTRIKFVFVIVRKLRAGLVSKQKCLK